MLATFLAFGELTSFWRLGSLTYLQRQGLCSFSLPQHMAEGGLEDVIAVAHGASSSGLQVTAAVHTWLPPKTRTKATTHNIATL